MKVLHLGVIRTADDVRTHIKNTKGIGESLKKLFLYYFQKEFQTSNISEKILVSFFLFFIVNYSKT